MICLGPGVLILTFIMFLIFTKIAKMCADSKNKKLNWQRLKNRTSILTGLVLFMIYPQIVELLLQSVNCFPSLEEEGPNDVPIYRVRTNPEIICTDEKYILYYYAMFVPGILIYVFIIPVVALYQMAKHSSVIYHSSQSSFKNSNFQALQDIYSMKSAYGFLYAGLNLGQAKSVDDKDNTDVELPDQKEEGVKGGCTKCLAKALSPINGKGVEVKFKKGT